MFQFLKAFWFVFEKFKILLKGLKGRAAHPGPEGRHLIGDRASNWVFRVLVWLVTWLVAHGRLFAWLLFVCLFKCLMLVHLFRSWLRLRWWRGLVGLFGCFL